jgi:release factor glutamine methyltransferase
MPQVPLKEALLRAGRQLSEAGCDTPVLDAELLAAKMLGLDRSRLIIAREHPLSDEQQECFRQLVARRSRREPLPYILGEWEFYGLKFAVSPTVLIPRPETEALVETGLEYLKGRDRDKVVGVDVGTGSGAIAIALAVNHPTLKIFATESSPAALELAKQNCQRHNLSEQITFLSGNLLEPLENLGRLVLRSEGAPRLRRVAGFHPPPKNSFDFIVANLPYIPTEVINTLAPEVRNWEPRAALDGGPDGLDLIRRLIIAAPAWLRSGGFLALEISPEQTEEVKALFIAAGFAQNRTVADLAGHNRVVMGIL